MELTGAAMEPLTAMKSAIATPEVITVETLAKAAVAISEAAVLKSLAPFKAASTVIEATSPVEAAPVVAAAIEPTTVETAPVIAVIPRARADKDSTHKIVWPVVAVMRASIGIIPVVTLGANRSRAHIGRANCHADNHSLCVRRNRHRHANGQQSNVLEITHFFALVRSRMFVRNPVRICAFGHFGFVRSA